MGNHQNHSWSERESRSKRLSHFLHRKGLPESSFPQKKWLVDVVCLIPQLNSFGSCASLPKENFLRAVLRITKAWGLNGKLLSRPAGDRHTTKAQDFRKILTKYGGDNKFLVYCCIKQGNGAIVKLICS